MAEEAEENTQVMMDQMDDIASIMQSFWDFDGDKKTDQKQKKNKDSDDNDFDNDNIDEEDADVAAEDGLDADIGGDMAMSDMADGTAETAEFAGDMGAELAEMAEVIAEMIAELVEVIVEATAALACT